MRVKASADTRLRTMNPIYAPDLEWQGHSNFSDGKLPAGITVHRYINKLDE